MRFLETNTFMGDDICILIENIECVYLQGSHEQTTIVIKMKDGSTNYTEGFNDSEKLNARYNQIKKIIGAA